MRLSKETSPSGHDSDRSRSMIAIPRSAHHLAEFRRGLHPAILARGGLRPALKTLGRRCTVPVELDMQAEARLPERVEVAAYYVVAEALTNAAKHAQASVIHVSAEMIGHALRLSVRDDGAGGADPVRGNGLTGLKDRVEALGGTITVQVPSARAHPCRSISR